MYKIVVSTKHIEIDQHIYYAITDFLKVKGIKFDEDIQNTTHEIIININIDGQNSNGIQMNLPIYN